MNPDKCMPVVPFRIETIITQIKIITRFALESWPSDWHDTTAVT